MKKDPASRRAALPEGSTRETDRALAGGRGGSETLGATGTSPDYTSEHPFVRMLGWCTPRRRPKPASAQILVEPQTSFLTAVTSPASAGASAPARAGAGCQTRASNPAEPKLAPVTAASSLLSCKNLMKALC